MGWGALILRTVPNNYSNYRIKQGVTIFWYISYQIHLRLLGIIILRLLRNRMIFWQVKYWHYRSSYQGKWYKLRLISIRWFDIYVTERSRSCKRMLDFVEDWKIFNRKMVNRLSESVSLSERFIQRNVISSNTF